MPSHHCDTARPSTNSSDHTGRLRALWVSNTSLNDTANLSGQIYKRTYTWAADQVKVQDTCLLTNSHEHYPRREQYYSSSGGGYDGLLRLVAAERPDGTFNPTSGGAFGRRNYGYDNRGNRTSEILDGCIMSSTLTYGTGSKLDRLLGRSTGCGGNVYSFTHNKDGQTTK